MRVKLISRLGDNPQSGLELDRHYAVHAGPDPQGTVLVYDDHTTSFCPLTRAEYREVPDPLEPHDLLGVDQEPGGYRAVCTYVWHPWQPAADPDAAVAVHRRHLRQMELDGHHLTTVVHPRLQEWINDLPGRRGRQEPER